MLRSRRAVSDRFFRALSIVALTLSGATVAAAQSEIVIHTFPTGKHDGFSTNSGLVADGSGALYGVTQTGGISCSENTVGCGIAYKLTPPSGGVGAWRETILYSFTGGTDGGAPAGNLLINSAAGVVYGTASLGGAKNFGVVFAFTPGNPWTETPIYAFKGSEGAQPTSGVVLHNGNLFGAANGGTNGVGALYRLRPPATLGQPWREQTLYQFTFGSDGGFPFATPIFDNTGTLYGTTFNGASNAGTIYKLAPPSGGTGPWTLTTLYAFTGGADGGNSRGSLVFDNSGALYGTTEGGGADGFGTVFKLTPPAGGTGPWTESVLYSFTGATDGAIPQAGVIFDSTGDLYGATGGGGDLSCGNGGGCGTLFKLTPPVAPGGAWTESVLYAFQGGSDGEEPLFTPLLRDNKLYGTTMAGGGTKNGGIAFEVTP